MTKEIEPDKTQAAEQSDIDHEQYIEYLRGGFKKHITDNPEDGGQERLKLAELLEKLFDEKEFDKPEFAGMNRIEITVEKLCLAARIMGFDVKEQTTLKKSDGETSEDL
jgi:hypothetical protein